MSLIDEEIAEALHDVRKLAGVEVTYSNGTSSVTLQHVGVGKTEYEIDEDGVIVETWVSRDYLIHRTKLVLAGSQVLPTKGDTIVEVINNVSKTFTVLAPGDKPIFEFSDRGQTQLRVHTKETV